jgi:GT2 family glycosyltransferase
MIPKIIHYCWFGDAPIPDDYAEYIKGWKKLHPKFKIIKWSEKNSPMDHAYMKKAVETKSWSNMSNFIRLYALKTQGGIYLDTDMNLLKSLDPLLSNDCFMGFEEGQEDSPVFWVNNAIVGAIKKHPFVSACFDTLLSDFDGSEVSNESGPRLTTKMLKNIRGLKNYGYQVLTDVVLYPTQFFYPVGYEDAYRIKKIDLTQFHESYAVHMWGRSWFSRDFMLQIIDDLQESNVGQKKIIQNHLSNIQNLEGAFAETDNQRKLLWEMNLKNETTQNALLQLENNISAQLNQTNEKLDYIEEIKNESTKVKEILLEGALETRTRLSASEEKLTVLDELFRSSETQTKIAHENFNNIGTIVSIVEEIRQENKQLKEILHKSESEEELKKISRTLEVMSSDNRHLRELQEKGENTSHLLLQVHNDLLSRFSATHEKLLETNKELFEKEKQVMLEKINSMVNSQNQQESHIIEHIKSNTSEMIQTIQDTLKNNHELEIVSAQNKNLEIQLKQKSDSNTTLQNEFTALKKEAELLKEEGVEKNKAANELLQEVAALKKEIGDLYLTKWDLEQTVIQKQREIDRSTKKIKEKNEETSKLWDAIAWYKETYETRKLHGIAKDRVLKNLAGFTSFVKAKKKYAFDNIVCTIVNYNCNENAHKLRQNISKFVHTIVIDSGSSTKDSSFINLGNVYYSGLFNHAYEYAKKNNYPYVFFVCSDVVFDIEQTSRIFENLKSIDFSTLGIYSPSSTGRSHFHCHKHNENGFRIVPFVEGFIFLASIDVLEKLAPINTNVNLLGWGIDTVSGYFCKNLSKLCIIDDNATVYHPKGTGYENQQADVQMEKWVNSFNNPELTRFHDQQINLIRWGINDGFKVSVIIPCYNQGEYLVETIESLLNQEYCNYELIIVNDGSTDNTDEIARELAAKYNQIKYINQKNAGLGAARNTGIKASTGTLIQFLDSDDLLSAEKLISQINDFIADSSLDVSYTNYLCFDDDDKEKKWTYSRVNLEGDPALDLIMNWEKELSIPVHCFLFKKSSIEGIFFDVNLPNHEDWNFHLKVSARKLKYKHAEKGTAFYRYRAKSMSRDREIMIKGKKMCLENIVELNIYNQPHLNELKKRISE